MAKKTTKKKVSSVSNPPLSPGKDHFIDAKDLDPAMFRRLVTRRIRMKHPDKDYELPEEEEKRRDFESQLEKISEEIDFLPVAFLTDGAMRSRAVCRMVVPSILGRSLGTGFLITPNLIMTNNHVVSSLEEAREATAEFQFESDLSPIVVALRPDRFFMTHVELDFTIVACDGRGISDITPIPLLRNPALVTRHEQVNIIQHPRGRKKEVALHNNKVTRVMDKVIRYSTDTEPGSSGSPVFNNNWDLVALHHAGFNENGTVSNEGIRISTIIDRIIRRAGGGGSENDREIMSELLADVMDSSPILGFFGTEGLGVGEMEVQVNGFQGTPNFADIGCWNIEHFNNRVADRRVEEVAEVVHQLSLDAFGLTEVENGAMRRLVQDLNAQGSRYDYVLRDTRGSQDIAVLFDTDTTEVVRRKDIADRNISRLRDRTDANKTAFPRFPLFAQCTVKHEEGDTVEFIMIVVHLKAFGDVQSRSRRRLAAKNLAEIIEDIRENEDLPVVLCGDFNEKLDNDVLSSLTETPDLFPLTADDATDGAISYVGRRFRSLIDHIIVSRDLRLGEISGDDAAIVRLDRSVRDFSDDISDHVPLVLRLILRDEPRDVEPDTGDGDAILLDIPSGSSQVRVGFE